MIKKLLLTCILIISVLSIIGCTANKGVVNQDNVTDLDYKASITVDNTKDLAIIANKLFTEYLNYYKKDTTKDNLKLKDYKINQITIKNQDDSSFQFFVDFSVQPVNTDTWLTPNGVKSNDWIYNKTYFVKVSIKGNAYSIENKSTSQ